MPLYYISEVDREVLRYHFNNVEGLTGLWIDKFLWVTPVQLQLLQYSLHKRGYTGVIFKRWIINCFAIVPIGEERLSYREDYQLYQE